MKKEQSSVSNQKVILPNKELVGVKKEINESSKLPNPTGWRILVLPYRGQSKTKGGVYLTDKHMEERGYTTVTGLVLKVGPDAYKDEKRFPDGPWCKVNDWIMFGRYAGSRFGIEGGEVRILNDDEIIAVVKDPEDILQYK